MGYIDNLMGRNEQIQFVARQHWVALSSRILGSLFTFFVFLALGLLIRPGDEKIAHVIGIIVLCTLLLPLYQIVASIVRGKRRGELFREIWRPVLIALFILIMGLALLLVPTTWLAIAIIALIISILPLVNTVRTYLDWFNERYAITNRRVMLIRGIINKHVSDSALEKVNDVVLEQSVIGRLLGYGDVEIITGSDIGVNEFHRIANPVRFKREMLNAKENYRLSGPDLDEERAISPRASTTDKTAKPGDAVPSKADIPDLIAELDELRQKGIISEEEFQAKKTELLARL
jgi:hypothetical protein